MRTFFIVSMLFLASINVQADPSEKVYTNEAALLQAKEENAGPQERLNGRPACALCWSCGGFAPYFAGSFAAANSSTVEYGAGCSGSLITRSDSRPYLCCQ